MGLWQRACLMVHADLKAKGSCPGLEVMKRGADRGAAAGLLGASEEASP